LPPQTLNFAMMLTCYYCNTDRPKSEIKRCSRCLLVTYCSKECQTASWKASHKYNCKIHPSLASPDDPDKPVSKADRPKKFTQEWIDLEVDKALSRWLQLWRSCFQTWTCIALDLANHPPERVLTHCMQLIVQPVNFEDDPAKQYELVEASVVKLSDVLVSNPQLEVTIDPTDFTRVRFVLILQNYRGEPQRLRLVQWNDLNAIKWRSRPKERSTDIASGWAEALAFSLNNWTPAEVEEMLGKKRQSESASSHPQLGH